jgi:hypothetical protein
MGSGGGLLGLGDLGAGGLLGPRRLGDNRISADLFGDRLLRPFDGRLGLLHLSPSFPLTAFPLIQAATAVYFES